VRVSTLAIPTTTEAQDVFRASDQDALCAALSRQAVEFLGFYSRTPASSSEILKSTNAKGSLLKARTFLITVLVNILSNYRKYTEASQSPVDQLILPDALKLLPLFILSFLKSPVVRCSLPKSRTVKSHPPSPRVDARATRVYDTCFAPLSLTFAFVHPNFYDVTTMEKDVGLIYEVEEDGDGGGDVGGGGGGGRSTLDVDEETTRPFIKLPPTILPSMTSLTQDGVYLMDAVDVMYLYVTRLAKQSVTSELFNVDAPLGDPSTPLPKALSPVSDLGSRLLAVIGELKKERSKPCPLEVVVQGREDCSVLENQLNALLVDDSTVHEVSYIDFLVAIHRKIQERNL
jgi:protein transport protein SEC24